MSNNCLIIVAAGLGTRMKVDLPKQFIKINGKEIITHVILKFKQFDSHMQIIIAVNDNYLELLNNIVQSNKFENIVLCKGGVTRFESVKNCLAQIKINHLIVGIHDAARPLVSLETIKNCFERATNLGNAIPFIAINETIRKDINGVNESVNRNEYKIIQTPQCFLVSKIKKAFEQNYSESFTDDASVFEASGEQINLVQGNVENIKITNLHDLIIAKALIENEQ